jgi:putative tryptophan/tyrosine transport system substrate-binding protein
MKRREFIAGLGSAAAWPLAGQTQQRIPVVGVLSTGTPEISRPLYLSAAFREALNETGFVEDRNVTFEFRDASQRLREVLSESRMREICRSGSLSRVCLEALPALAADLVGQHVDLIYTGGLPGVIAAKAATATVPIPIVFTMGEDPVKEGIVTSLNRPGGNATGFTGFSNQLMAKRLDVLHQAVPKATIIGFLVNPDNPNADPDTSDARAAALAGGLTLRVLTAASERDFERVFATISDERIGALLVGVEPFFWSTASVLAALAARHAVPVLYDRNIFPIAGGLMSYGTSPAERDRIAGLYVGRILKGAKPAELPVMQATRFEFVINLKTARTLGLEISPQLTALADEVIQ